MDADEDKKIDRAIVDYTSIPRDEASETHERLEEYLRERNLSIVAGEGVNYCGMIYEGLPDLGALREQMKRDSRQITSFLKQQAAAQNTVKYASFKLSQGNSKASALQALVVPPDQTLTLEKVMEAVKKRWGLELPNLLVTVDIGTRHPSSLAT